MTLFYDQIRSYYFIDLALVFLSRSFLLTFVYLSLRLYLLLVIRLDINLVKQSLNKILPFTISYNVRLSDFLLSYLIDITFNKRKIIFAFFFGFTLLVLLLLSSTLDYLLLLLLLLLFFSSLLLFSLSLLLSSLSLLFIFLLMLLLSRLVFSKSFKLLVINIRKKKDDSSYSI